MLRTHTFRLSLTTIRQLILCAPFFAFLCWAEFGRAALIDVWRAEDLTLNDGDGVGAWNSASNRVASAAVAETPVLRRNATPAGGKAVRFSGTQRMSVSSSPVGGLNAFSVAIVFKAAAAGAADNAQWWGKTGLVDAEEPGVTSDWGTALTETGQVGIGTGNGDVSTYSSGPSLVGSNYHVAVFTWGGSSQSVYVDNRPGVTQGPVSSTARNSAGISFGGIRTGEANRRLNGDLVEIRFYNTALSSIEASNVIGDLSNIHLFGTLPRIFSFAGSTNQIYLGQSATLSWAVSNAISVVIDPTVGSVSASNSVSVSPSVTTTYTLTATNLDGARNASVTVAVDPGIPFANNLTTNTTRNTARALTLSGSDPQGSNLTYSISVQPSHGSLSGTPPNIIYTPTTDYDGFDSFTFTVNDGMFDSAPATVSIKVIPPPTAPSAIILSSVEIPSTAKPDDFIAALRAVDVNNSDGDTQSFSLTPGFGDNSKFKISGNVLSAGPGFAGGPGTTFSIRIRAADSTGLTYDQTFSLSVVDRPRTVVINEIHYNGPSNVVQDSFIELCNPTDSAIDISHWRLTGGVDFFFPPNSLIPAHGFAVLAESPATVQQLYGAAAFGPWNGGLNNDGENLSLRDALNNSVDEVNFQSEFPWPIAANGNGPSAQLINPTLDNDLGSSWMSGIPTPGATNSVFATNAPPNIRQVEHTPRTPSSSNQVAITCKVTDPEGVASVVLWYQVVAPGNYVPATFPLIASQLNSFNTNPTQTNAINPAFESVANWTAVPMHDDGVNGDAVAGDNIYSATIPQQANRTLVRYRITVTDSLGASRRAPFEDDPSLNFAYFVYNGVPAYLGFSSTVLQTLPVYSVIVRDSDINQCTAWFNSSDQLPQANGDGSRNEGRIFFNWEAALVYDGVVYDHVHYRLRGANGRYQSGKRSFRFRFNEGHLLNAKDQNGKRFPTQWRELTTGKGQSNRGGEFFALNERVNFYLFNKVDVPAPSTFYFHFRVIRGASEAGADQYSGDFWGLNWAQEKYDVNFLQSHDLPKGNFYKLVDNYVLGLDERRYQSAQGPTGAQDFFNIQNNLNGFKSTDWLLAHVNYTNWYRYNAICEAIRHLDFWPSANKNGAWYFEPIYTAANDYLGRMMTLPYDTTDTWGPTWNSGYDISYNGIFNVFSPPAPIGGAINTAGGDAGDNPGLQLEYRNTVRAIRDLLFQPDQINPIIDAHAALIRAFVPADMARWTAAPAPASYNSLAITGTPGATGGVAGVAQDMKNFMFTGGNYPWWIDRNAIGAGGWVTRLDAIAAAAGDSTAIPVRPTVTYIGTNNYPVDGLLFQSSSFADPQGAGTFGAMRWRIAEVMSPGTVVTNPADLILEWDAAWESDELTDFNPTVGIPEFVVKPDHLYRVRVRHKDNTGRWSQWSLPSEFRPSPRDTVSQLRTNLVFSEIMYNPPGEGATSGDEFEFIELKNVGPYALNLSGLFFSAGINFSFTNGSQLAPGQLFLLARNPGVLATRYAGVLVNGTYTGKLDNGGEKVAISHPVAGEIISVTYDDVAPWPVAADGFGFALVLDPATGAYRPSAERFGSPGSDGGLSAIGGVVINEVLSSSTLPLKDTIELLNTASTNVDVSGWYLSDDPSLPQKFRIPDGPPLAPGDYRTFNEDDFNPTPGLGVSFGLNSFGDDIYLFSADAAGQLTGYSHGFSFGAAQDGVSFGRYINSVGEEQFALQSTRTLGAANAGPRVEPVVISEINYHPRNSIDEFLEIQNVLASDMPLYDPANPTNTWRLSGLGFTFPTNISIPANGFVLLVNDDPAAFRARFAVPPEVQIFQYAGALQDSGENLELQAPDLPTTNGVPYFAYDTVRYNDRTPWPLAADGAGASLQRINSSAYGNDPINWLAARPTPGRQGLIGVAPLITTQPASRTNATTGTSSFSVVASGSAPLFYQWRFNGGNITDATNANLVLSNLKLADSGNYSAVVFNSAGSAQSGAAALLVRPGPVVTTNPTNVFVRIKPDTQAAPTTNATFTASATSYNPPLRYQWQFNGISIAGATNLSLTVTNVQLTNEGNYVVVVTDAIGSTASVPASLVPMIKPILTVSPIAQSVVTGAVVTVSAAATGNPLPFTWEWRRGVSTVLIYTNNERFSFFTFVAPTTLVTNSPFRVVLTNIAGSVFSQFNMTTVPDSDRDGIPDGWEVRYGLNSTNAADADLDSDGDGLTNWQEYNAGTDPTNDASSLKLSLSVTGAQATLSFGATSNKTYSVQYADQPSGGAWSKVADLFARTNNHVETVIDLNWTTNRFYRAVTPRQP
jgi:hypothetical protein